MTNTPPSSVTVIIVAWNSGDDLQACLDALHVQSFREFNVFIWDNNSTDGSIESVNWPANTQLHRSAENVGFAVAINRAVEIVDSPLIALLNPDAFPETEWLGSLVDTQNRTKAAAVASVQLAHSNPEVLDGVGDNYSVYGVAWRGGDGWPRCEVVLREGFVISACAAAALYDRRSLIEAGGFDERYFCYFEDLDLGLRLRWRGQRTALAPAAIVRHIGSVSMGRRAEQTMYYGTRNRIFTFAKCMPFAVWVVALPAFLVANAYFILASTTAEERRGRWRGLIDGVRNATDFITRRPSTGASLVRQFDVIRALAWNPLTMIRRAVIIQDR